MFVISSTVGRSEWPLENARRMFSMILHLSRKIHKCEALNYAFLTYQLPEMISSRCCLVVLIELVNGESLSTARYQLINHWNDYWFCSENRSELFRLLLCSRESNLNDRRRIYQSLSASVLDSSVLFTIFDQKGGRAHALGAEEESSLLCLNHSCFVFAIRSRLDSD